jgi:hypothetical protein
MSYLDTYYQNVGIFSDEKITNIYDLQYFTRNMAYLKHHKTLLKLLLFKDNSPFQTSGSYSAWYFFHLTNWYGYHVVIGDWMV